MFTDRLNYKVSKSWQFVANQKQTLTAILHWEEDVYDVAECPEVGTASQGETVEEALANLKEATELYLEEFLSFNTSALIVSYYF